MVRDKELTLAVQVVGEIIAVFLRADKPWPVKQTNSPIGITFRINILIRVY
jgi:hypothetical protein